MNESNQPINGLPDFQFTPPLPQETATSIIIARADALAAIQRRLFSCDHVQLEAIMKTVYRKPVVVVSEVDETEQYLEMLKRFE